MIEDLEYFGLDCVCEHGAHLATLYGVICKPEDEPGRCNDELVIFVSPEEQMVIQVEGISHYRGHCFGSEVAVSPGELCDLIVESSLEYAHGLS